MPKTLDKSFVFLKYITACNYKLNKLLFKLYVND